MIKPILKAALALLDNRFSVIPCKADKTPAISSWSQYQKVSMIFDEAKRCFSDAVALAVIAGEVSGNLECLDIDDPAVYLPFMKSLAENDPALSANVAKRRTPSGGYHIIYRCTGPVGGNLKLACDNDGAVRIETRGQGGYFLTSPTPGYEVLEHSLLAIPTLSPAQVELIHSLARTFDRRQAREQLDRTALPPTKKPPRAGQQESPGDRFNSENTVSDLLTRYGWKPFKKESGGMGWTRPGKEAGTSGVVLESTGNFYVWSSNATPLDSQQSYSAFALFTAYEHSGNFTAAARSLADKGHVATSGTTTGCSSATSTTMDNCQVNEQSANPDIDAAVIVVSDAIDKAKNGDPAAVFEVEALASMRLIKRHNEADFQRLRLTIKKTSKDIRISDFDAALRGHDGAGDAEKVLADMLVDLARERCQLFKTEDREPYATFETNNHRECWRIGSEGFSEWLSFSFYREYGRVPNERAMSAALSTLSGVAKFEGDTLAVSVRVANHNGAIWLDLANDEWQAVEIRPEGWRIVDTPPVMFTRSKDMRPLPKPESGGDMAPLWEVVNIPEGERLIVVAWLFECLRMETPFAVLELTGEQGSAKSTTQHYLRELVDPNRANLRTAPKAVEDVFVSAKNAHMVSFENLSYLKPEYQDALCVLATGGGYASRTLYTNNEETVFNVMKPVVLNGIAVIVTAQDLLDRTVHINLPSIEGRLTAEELTRLFEDSKAGILGGLLDLFVKVLELMPSVEIDPRQRPRMADFARLGEAVYRVHGRPEGSFLEVYKEKRRDGVHRTLDSSPVAVACLAWLEVNPYGHDATVKSLFEAVTPFRPEGEAWPRSAKGFADALRRIAPALRMIGINAKIGDRPGKHGYSCVLKRVGESGISPKGVKESNEVHQVNHVHPRPTKSELGEHGELVPGVLPLGECMLKSATSTVEVAI